MLGELSKALLQYGTNMCVFCHKGTYRICNLQMKLCSLYMGQAECNEIWLLDFKL